MSRTRKSVVLFSGGLDSAVTLALALENGFEAFPLCFDYGQSNRKEVDYAKKLVTSHFHHTLKVCSIPGIADLAGETPMLSGSTEVKSFARGKTVIPNRNAVFLSLAGMYAGAIGASYIHVGFQNEKKPGSKVLPADTSMPFCGDTERLIAQYSMPRRKRMRIVAPLVNTPKKTIIWMAQKRGISLEDTWSCHLGNENPCGICDPCMAIKSA